MLSLDNKEKKFLLGIRFGRKTNTIGMSLESIVNAAMNKPFWWSKNKNLNPSTGITGAIDWNGGYAYQVTTAPCEKDPAKVSFVLAHEVGHILFSHYDEGSFIYGFYTPREADAFAFSYLYTTAQKQTPCGKTMHYNALFKAICEVHADDNGFSWEKRLEDIALIKKLQG